MLLIGFTIPRSLPQSPVVTRHPLPSPAVLHSPLQSPVTPYTICLTLQGPAVLPKDGRPVASRTGADRVLPSRPVRGSWQSPRRAPRGPRTVENTRARSPREIVLAVKRICSEHSCLLFLPPPFRSPSTNNIRRLR